MPGETYVYSIPNQTCLDAVKNPLGCDIIDLIVQITGHMHIENTADDEIIRGLQAIEYDRNIKQKYHLSVTKCSRR